MQLVGAKKWFIQRPFLIQALWHGALAGAIASTLLFLLISFATKKIEDLVLIQNNDRLLLLGVVLLLIGMIVAVASTFRAVAKYLGLSLDELY
jgi:cell division transport system permease protein